QAERYRDRALAASCERALGWAQSFSGDAGGATAHYERAARMLDELGDLSSAAEVRVSLGHVYAEQGALPLAEASFEEALALAERLDQTRGRGYALDNLGALRREAGDLDRAVE